MFDKVYITGDTHGDMKRFSYLLDEPNPKNVAVIILGDAGVNYYLNQRDKRTKEILKNYLFRFYLVRGNHEARPEDIETMIEIYDQDVKNFVYMEPEYPSIRYLKDGGIYNINGYRTLVIGGAYSVDKFYRLERGWTWFDREQLTGEELGNIRGEVFGEKFDLVLTHTCPFSWRPTDLFLSFIDQDSVDNFMEYALENIKEEINWDVWLFAHYHTDRAERPGVEIYYRAIENLDDIWARWHDDKKYGKGILKSPNFDKGE